MAKIEKNCWTKRNVLEKFLVIIILLLMTLTVALVAILALQQVSGTQPPTTCLTPDCVKASALILDFIDPSVDPCENFYDFACGNYLKSSLETQVASPSKILDKITENRLNALITEPTNESLPLPLEQQRRFYRSCCNTTAIDGTYKETLLGLIEKLGGWPVLKPRIWDERRFDWINATIKCWELGLFHRHFLSVSGKDDDDTGLFLLSIRRPLINVVEEQHKEAYVEAMACIAVDLGVNVYHATTEFRRVLHFQEQLDKIAGRLDIDKKLKVTIGEMSQKNPGIPWLQLLKGVTRGLAVVDENTLLTWYAERYSRNLTALLARTSKSTQANYMVWRVIEYYYKILGTNIRSCYSKFLVVSDEDYHRIEDGPHYCLQKARQYFPFVAEVAYVRKYTPPQLKRNVEEMVEDIRRQILQRMRASDWMDEATKTEAEMRLKRIESYTGWSEAIFEEDFAKLVKLDGFTLPSDNLLEIVRKLNVRDNDNLFKNLNKNFSELTKLELKSSPILTVNAYYAPGLEVLILPSSVLQGQFYDNNRPQYMNYGALGSVIGHEFTHGLTSSDDLQDQEVKWWSPETKENFKQKSQCLVQQYNNYPNHLQGFTKNGSQALDENFADLLGPSLAYRAYQEWVTKHGEEKLLPGVNYTANQIFWIMFGSFKCFQPNTGLGVNIPISPTPHGVPSFGVIASTRNSPDFASDFGCLPNSAMNPLEKCEIV